MFVLSIQWHRYTESVDLAWFTCMVIPFPKHRLKNNNRARNVRLLLSRWDRSSGHIQLNTSCHWSLLKWNILSHYFIEIMTWAVQNNGMVYGIHDTNTRGKHWLRIRVCQSSRKESSFLAGMPLIKSGGAANRQSPTIPRKFVALYHRNTKIRMCSDERDNNIHNKPAMIQYGPQNSTLLWTVVSASPRLLFNDWSWFRIIIENSHIILTSSVRPYSLIVVLK